MFEVKRGVLSGKADLCIPMSGNAIFLQLRLADGFPAVRSHQMYCQQEKKPPGKVFFQVQTDTPFHNGTAAKKATRTSSADFRAHRRCLLILPRHDQGRSNLCVVRLEIPNRSKNEKTKSPSTCKHTKKKRNENRIPKITSWGNLKFRSCSQPS